MEYLLILILFFGTALFAEWKFKIHLYHSQKERITISLFFFLIGIIWDSYAVWRHHWTFLGTGLVGINIGLLPIEEYLFSLIIPFWILTFYKLLDRKIN